MPRHYRFRTVDVFTERMFGGNQLAVFLEPAGLSDAEMQGIARELNIAETTFVFPPSHADCVARVRIFTPASELPFAGHPTVGTAWVLANEGRVGGATRIALEEGIGPVAVELEGPPTAPTFVWMRHRDATFEPEVRDRAGVARALGLTEGDLLPRAPVQTVSTGNPFVFVPLRDRQVVDRSALDVATLLASFGETLVGVFVFAPDGEARVYSRMFAPHHGVPEDAATGSGSGPLIAYLVTHGLAPKGEHVRIVSEQGTKMGRQSFLHMTARAVDGRATEIRVGGGVVPVLEGRLELP